MTSSRRFAPSSIRIGKLMVQEIRSALEQETIPTSSDLEQVTQRDPVATTDAQFGGKIILPASVLRQVSRFDAASPMVFRLSQDTIRATKGSIFCGVLTFDADEGSMKAPDWMMRQLNVQPDQKVVVDFLISQTPKGEFAKFQPQSTSFLEVDNPKAVLERCLRNYACLTANDVIAINYSGAVYNLKVCQVAPATTIAIIDCDLNVDFEPPPGYVEKVYIPPEADLDRIQAQVEREMKAKGTFGGAGQRLDGKAEEPKTASKRSPAKSPSPSRSKKRKTDIFGGSGRKLTDSKPSPRSSPKTSPERPSDDISAKPSQNKSPTPPKSKRSKRSPSPRKRSPSPKEGASASKGKGANAESPKEKATPKKKKIGVPDYDYQFGTIIFKRRQCDVARPLPPKPESPKSPSIATEPSSNSPGFIGPLLQLPSPSRPASGSRRRRRSPVVTRSRSQRSPRPPVEAAVNTGDVVSVSPEVSSSSLEMHPGTPISERDAPSSNTPPSGTEPSHSPGFM